MDTPSFLSRLLGAPWRKRTDAAEPSNNAGVAPPVFSVAERQPVKLTTVHHPDGRMSQYPPPEMWDDWVEWDPVAWPKKKPRHYTLVPTICFNCESGCGLLAYVDKQTHEVKKFEGNPVHPGSRGRNCAKGPATHNQVYDPERILYPLKRVGKRGEGKWARVSWEEALTEIAAKMQASRQARKDGIMYHVGRPGEDHFANRCITAWGVDGHNSHTNICSSGARTGYMFWAGFDRPSPDYANARAILLISSHLETGHYFNPHAQRIIEAMEAGAKLVVLDPRLSNTASKADVWLPTWPGSETELLLAIANHLLTSGRWNREFVRRWVNWRETIAALPTEGLSESALAALTAAREKKDASFEDFEALLRSLYAEFTFERAAASAQVPIERIRAAAEAIADAGDRVAAHVWRSASIGNRGGWQVARCLFLLNVLTGSVGTKGGTSGNSWNKFVPKPFSTPTQLDSWQELHLPHEWPFAAYELSFLLPHFLEEGRGDIDVYFTRVYNPLWINPDGFSWMRVLADEEKIKCHVALTPTWNESAWFADYVLPMGHAGERHDLQSQETHVGQWLGFRQPVRRVALERAGQPVEFTYQANPGEVWEEAEWWVELSWRMDPDGKLGVRQWFESPYREGEKITLDEYFGWIFENSVPGLPEKAEAEGLTPLAYMKTYGVFEIVRDNYVPYEKPVATDGTKTDEQGRLVNADGVVVGVMIEGEAKKGFGTPSGKLEFFSPTLHDWGWPEPEHTLPWTLPSHVAPSEIDREQGEMLLLPNFRLPTLIHTRSANAKWLYEISHNNPLWMHPSDGERLGLVTGDLARVDTETGYFIDRVYLTEGIKPGIIACSHHLGRWRLAGGELDGKPVHGQNPGMSNIATLGGDPDGVQTLEISAGGGAWDSSDPDTSRIWWREVGVHQNLTHGVHPDPISGAHCWLQRAVGVRKASQDEQYGTVHVDANKAREVYRQWKALTRSAVDHSPDGTRRPMWIKRPLKPTKDAYALPENPFGR